MTEVITPSAPATGGAGTAATAIDDPVARAAGLREGLAERAHTCDELRRLPEETLGELRETGLLRLFTPARWGGREVGLRTYLDVLVELGKGCCSTGWVTGVLNAGNLIVASFPEAAQAEVWAENPDASTAFFLGRPSLPTGRRDGGLVLSGSWPYFSGSLHSEWMAVLVIHGAPDTRPGPYVALLPASDVRVEDTWHMAGLRGTGSNTVVADEVFVPEHRLLPFESFVEGSPEGSETWRRKGLAGLSVGLLGTLLGGVQTALGSVLEQGHQRPVAASTYPNQAASPSFQLDVAEASTLLDTAFLHAWRIADTADEVAATHATQDERARARSRMDAAHVARNCREAMDVLLTAYGSSAFNESNPLQRIWRDVNVGTRHAAFGMGIPQQVFGSALVGADPRRISFLD